MHCISLCCSEKLYKSVIVCVIYFSCALYRPVMVCVYCYIFHCALYRSVMV